MSVAVVLSGAAALGAYQIGVLDHLVTAVPIDVRTQCCTPTILEAHRAGGAHHRPVAAGRSCLRADRAPLPGPPDQFADAFARAWFKLTHRELEEIRADFNRSTGSTRVTLGSRQAGHRIAWVGR